MQDSLEDRICAAGRHDEFTAALDTFREGKKRKADEHILYDKLTNLGASPEEADEFINMVIENG